MAQEYPTSPNPWIGYLSPKSKSNSSSLAKILSSKHAQSLLTVDFNQQAEKTFKQSHTYKFVAFSEKIDILQNKLFNLKEHFHHMQALKDLTKLISREKLNEYLNALDVLTNLFIDLLKQKDLINSILSIETDNCDFSLHPSIHTSFQQLLTDIKKSVSTINSFQNDLIQIKALSCEGSLFTNLREIVSYLDQCMDNYNATFTKISELTRLV